MATRVLVTGGAGFIGSHIAVALRDAGHEVRVLDLLLEAAHREPPPPPPDGIELVIGDVRDRAVVDRALEGVGAVCHQAAMVGLGVDLGDLGDYVSHNDVGTATLLGALAARRDEIDRLVLAASMVVYGEGRYACPEHGVMAPGPRAVADLAAGRFEPPCPRCGAALEPRLVPEEASADPRNVYAATKLHQEHLAAAFSRETGVPVSALRYHNVYGPAMPRDTPYAGVAAIFRSALEAGGAPRVFEDGGQRRDFVHVADVARANVLALTTDTPVAGPLNIGSGTPHTVGEMARALWRAGGADPAAEPVVTGEFRLGDVRHINADTSAAAERLGFRAGVGFEEGMTTFAAAPLRR